LNDAETWYWQDDDNNDNNDEDEITRKWLPEGGVAGSGEPGPAGCDLAEKLSGSGHLNQECQESLRFLGDIVFHLLANFKTVGWQLLFCKL
jgi:hypothetical protein